MTILWDNSAYAGKSNAPSHMYYNNYYYYYYYFYLYEIDQWNLNEVVLVKCRDNNQLITK